VRLLLRAYIGRGALDPVEFAGEIEWSLARPGELHQFEIFRSPPVTLGLRAEVAISLLLVVGLAGDDVHGEPSVGQMVERRDLAGHQGRRNESRPMRYEVAELLCVRGSVKRDEEPFCGRRGAADERQVKAGVVVCARKLR